MAGNDARRVELGKIVGHFGVKGWVKVKSYTRPMENILAYKDWRLSDEKDSVDIRLVEGQRHGHGLIARLQRITGRELAHDLIGKTVSVARSEMPEQDSGSYYWMDLEGLDVVTEDGQKLGKVDYLLETGANDVLVVAGDVERLVPFVIGEFVKAVDLDAGVITVAWDPEF
jgi:16S rRNA processing protein RimM